VIKPEYLKSILHSMSKYTPMPTTMLSAYGHDLDRRVVEFCIYLVKTCLNNCPQSVCSTFLIPSGVQRLGPPSLKKNVQLSVVFQKEKLCYQGKKIVTVTVIMLVITGPVKKYIHMVYNFVTKEIY
jgi:hypothetical protein